jgi:hypothetical protein
MHSEARGGFFLREQATFVALKKSTCIPKML